MKFSDVVEQARTLLQRTGKVTYRVLKREFELDDESLEDLKEQLIEAEELAVEKDGKMLVWVGTDAEGEKGKGGNGETGGKTESANRGTGEAETTPQPPVTYTPTHLADRIRAVNITEGERKTITALFADLKGSTALIEGLDPEEARAVIDPALQLMMDAVHQYDGFVAQALGDGIFALFGAPLAHEDHPQRAVYAALRMQDAMRRYGETLRQQGYPPLQMRVGLNTGEVVLRSIRKDDLHADYVPVGHSTNLAARMEQLATPGSIVVSAYTHRLTDGYFAFKDLGPTQIKGVEEPLHIYEVLGVGQLRTRLQVSASRYGLTRFVGRQSEMDQLKRALEQTKAGQGQIVGVMGEPGLGKSRLFYEFKLLSLGGCVVLEAYSVSHGKATAYLPVIELLKSYFRIESPDDERTRREKVNGKVLTLDRNLEDTLPYLFALLGIEEQPSPLAQMDPQIRRRRTFEALKKLFLRESLNQPLVLIFEDLHWIDGETQGFLDVLSESVASAKLLLLTNYRPEYRHEWGQKTYYTQLRLAPFGKEEAEEFLDSLLSDIGSPLPARERDRVRVSDNNLHALKQLILAKTQGTPFFMEEIVQELVEQGVLVRDGVGARRAVPLPTDLHIPPTVQGILAARIDRLAPDEKALLQQLSVIGREFPLGLIRQVIPQSEADLYRILASLQHKEFLYEQPAFPESEYIFKHALTQEVAYGTVLQEQKKQLHERTGQALEHLHKDTVEEHYGELAHHYQRSANTEKAIEYLQLAGQQAVQRGAYTEAISHLTVALELLLTRPATPERTAQELKLRLALGPPLLAIRGYTAPEAAQQYTRARELCEQLGDLSRRFPALYGLWIFHLNRGELRIAQALAEECLRLAEQMPEAVWLLEAHSAVGATSLWGGEIVRARASLEQATTHYQPQQHPALIALSAQDLRVASFCLMAMALWSLGYPDQALTRMHEALRLSHALGHIFSLAFTLVFTTELHYLRREGQVTQDRAGALVTLSGEYGFSAFLARGTVLWGAALIVREQWTEGITQIQQGLKAYGGELRRTMYLACLAEGYRGAGQVEEGLATIAEALRLVEKNDERYYEAEVWRIKGELALRAGETAKRGNGEEASLPDPKSQILDPEGEAEAYFLKAIDIARQQQAKSLELRAVMSLVRLRQQQPALSESRNTNHASRNTQHATRAKLDEAHQMLSEIYTWFTEGFDTKDLQEAKELLEELH